MFLTHVDYQKTITVITSNRCSVNRHRKLDRLFKTAVGDFHLMVSAAFADVRVFTTATNAEQRAPDFDLQLVHTDSRKIHFYDPTIRRTIYVRGGIPETARRYNSPIRSDQRKITIDISHGDSIKAKKKFRHRSTRTTQL